MKLIFTITDASGLAHMGLDIERHSYIVEVPDENIPAPVKRDIEYERKEGSPPSYVTISISVLKEPKP